MRPWAAVGFLAIYNIAQNRLLKRRGYVAGNLAATGVGLTWALGSGITREELGLKREDISRGLLLGIGAATAGAMVVVATRADEWLGGSLDDERLHEVTTKETWFRLVIRFPLGTALFEEVWFRGILPAALRRSGVATPDLVSSTVFAAWHLIPTTAAINANPVGRQMSGAKKTLLVLGGSTAAGLGGLGFVWLRNVSRSLSAPWVTHAAFNGLAFWSAMRRRRSSS